MTLPLENLVDINTTKYPTSTHDLFIKNFLKGEAVTISGDMTAESKLLLAQAPKFNPLDEPLTMQNGSGLFNPSKQNKSKMDIMQFSPNSFKDPKYQRYCSDETGYTSPFDNFTPNEEFSEMENSGLQSSYSHDTHISSNGDTGRDMQAFLKNKGQNGSYSIFSDNNTKSTDNRITNELFGVDLSKRSSNSFSNDGITNNRNYYNF